MKSILKSAYQSVHSKLPPRFAQVTSDLVFTITNKPYVYRDSGLRSDTCLPAGAVTFSIDFEMAWAFRYSTSSKEHFMLRGRRERMQVPTILAAFDQYSIPATWATVGHLFLSQCDRGPDGLAHPEMPRVQHFDHHWDFSSGDWYQYDPCTDVKRDPAWYAPDLIEKILLSRSGHELACHTFSHIGFGAYCSAEVAAAELDACIRAMEPFGVRPTTLVFPGNQEGQFELIAQKGFRAVRAFPISWAELSVPVKLKDGLWHVHSSTSIQDEPGSENLDRRLRQLKKYVDRAVETKMSAHIWFHPSLSPLHMEGLLFPLLHHCAELRDSGVLDIHTIDRLVTVTENSLGVQGKGLQVSPG